MNLAVALCAIGIKRSLQGGVSSNVAQERRMVGAERARAMSGMATQAQKSRWLEQQVIRYRAMGFVADRAILRNRRMLVREWTLFLRMAFVTHHVHRRLFQIVLGLTVRIMAIGAHHLAFLDRMVRRHRDLCINIRMAFVARLRLVY